MNISWHVKPHLFSLLGEHAINEPAYVLTITRKATSSYLWQWRTSYSMETLSALLALFEGNPPVTDGPRSQRATNASFDVFRDVSLNKRLNSGVAGELRRYDTHCDVTVMVLCNGNTSHRLLSHGERYTHLPTLVLWSPRQYPSTEKETH